ncbi:cysteine-rich receptor-like protein kinase 3 [Punica granatum]|uniref:Cysteine-rich receptor-like protein kinase 3 n=1 Tax=Punica granatum TaxID=22663 RepID=A0A6P8CUC6_PUNGR|nr:cysteine-rich receptor-like protein kinase 3 [Punica granatum]
MGPSVFSVLGVLIYVSVLLSSSLADPRTTQVTRICTNRTALAANRVTFVANFVAAMDGLTRQLFAQGYGSVVTGSGSNMVYAFGECMRDLSQTDCDLCFAQCKIQIPRCFPFQLGTRAGRILYDGCYLRYDDYNFFNESLGPVDSTICATEQFSGNTTVFEDYVTELGKNLTLEAPKKDGFFVGSVTGGNTSVYGLAQCWKFTNDCRKCLNDSFSRIASCPPRREGRAINAGCYLRYSTEKFYYNNTVTAAAGRNTGRRLAIIVATTSSAFALLLIVAVAGIVRRKVSEKRRERRLLGLLANTVNKSKLNFSYETLEKATNYFDCSNKLGQGGSGSVYKGILPNGKPIAIKRLVFNTRQWVEHFFNEVNLISGIHHKNLVGLLGCSITGPESLLVYEYIPNLSLLDHLFVNKDVEPLNWETRSKIVLGTAEGLAYLHEESSLRIIHRDIKLSNVLLDDDFAPKIADFGLARLFPEDKTHISTAIAGTLGYMAPEYVVRGKLTEKADVYSYGVLVIEVITGKRNNSFFQKSFSILQTVWDMYSSGRLCEAVDPVLKGKFRGEDVSRILQIALLCVQASADLRPRMSMVVKMLSDDCDIPSPTQPPFLSSSHSASTERQRSVISGNFQPESDSHSSGNTKTESFIGPR